MLEEQDSDASPGTRSKRESRTCLSRNQDITVLQSRAEDHINVGEVIE